MQMQVATSGVPMPNIVAPLLQGPVASGVPAPVMMPSRSLPNLMERGPPPPEFSAPAPAAASNVPPSAPPPSLTANLPDPGAVQQQKDAHLKVLDDQLKEGLAKVTAQTKEKRMVMLAQAEKQKVDFGLMVDAEVRLQELDLDKQFLSVVQFVKQEATRQRAMLEQQAAQLAFQYQEKKVEEDMLAQQFELHKQQHAIQETIQRQAPIDPLRSLVPMPVPNQAQQTRGLPISPTPSAIPRPIMDMEVRSVQNNSYMPPVMAAPQVYTSSSYVPQVVTGGEIVTSSSYVPATTVVAPVTYMAEPPTITVSPASSQWQVAQTAVATPITPARVISTSPLPTTNLEFEPQPSRVLKSMTLTTSSAKVLSSSDSKARMAAPDYAAGSS